MSTKDIDFEGCLKPLQPGGTYVIECERALTPAQRQLISSYCSRFEDFSFIILERGLSLSSCHSERKFKVRLYNWIKELFK
jgi:hypothetical protein